MHSQGTRASYSRKVVLGQQCNKLQRSHGRLMAIGKADLRQESATSAPRCFSPKREMFRYPRQLEGFQESCMNRDFTFACANGKELFTHIDTPSATRSRNIDLVHRIAFLTAACAVQISDFQKTNFSCPSLPHLPARHF